MGVIKQRSLKAGRDYNYAEGVKVLNSTGTAIAANKIVCVVGHDGPYVKVALADEGAPATRVGRLHITKHELPASGYGVVLPWRLVTGLSNLANGGAPTGAGTVIYLGASGGWTTTKGSNGRMVGTVATAGSGAATTDGAIFFSGEGVHSVVP